MELEKKAKKASPFAGEYHQVKLRNAWKFMSRQEHLIILFSEAQKKLERTTVGSFPIKS